MTTEKRRRFEIAYQAWRSAPIEATDASAILWDESGSLVNTQTNLAPLLDALHRNGAVLPPPVAIEQWHAAQSYLLTRGIRTLRSLQQTRRQQVATRELLNRAQVLKEVWDAYRSIAGH